MKVLTFLLILAVGVINEYAAEIRGRVTSLAGIAFSDAVVCVSYVGKNEELARATPSPEGLFSLNVNKLGYMQVTIAASDHQQQQLKVFIPHGDYTLTLEASLGTNITKQNITNVSVIGDFNAWNFNSAQPMRRTPSGTYVARLPAESNIVQYQVLLTSADSSATKNSVNGTQHARLEYDGGGDFRSILYTYADSIDVEFDPSMLPQSDAQGLIREIGSEAERIRVLTENSRNVLDYLWSTKTVADGNSENTNEVLRTIIAPRALKQLRDTISIQPKGVEQQLLVYLALSTMAYSAVITAEDTALVSNCLLHIPPSSPVWTLGLEPMMQTYMKVGMLSRVIPDATTIHNYQEPDPDRLPWMYLTVCYHAAEHDTSLFAYAYRQLTEKYESHVATYLAKTELDPSRRIRAGARLPDFHFKLLDDSTATVSPESLRGKWVFIDLWATWCGPCISELPVITQAWEQYKSKNIEILSISFDADPTKVILFRKGRFAMPWKHVFSPGGFKSEAAEIFEVYGIPKPILVSPDGIITHVSNDLRGTALLDTLRKVLGS